jgi:Fe2+ transport system protein FeoA
MTNSPGESTAVDSSIRVFLDQVAKGRKAAVVSIHGDDSLVQRLYEMGFIEGMELEVLGFAPFGDPIEIRLGDYRLSLRRREAARIQVNLI